LVCPNDPISCQVFGWPQAHPDISGQKAKQKKMFQIFSKKFTFNFFSVRLLDLDNGRAEPSCGGGLLQKIPLIIYKLIGNERIVRKVLCYTATGCIFFRERAKLQQNIK
jgi:hypothetical protein